MRPLMKHTAQYYETKMFQFKSYVSNNLKNAEQFPDKFCILQIHSDKKIIFWCNIVSNSHLKEWQMSIVHLQDMKLNQDTTPAAAVIDKIV